MENTRREKIKQTLLLIFVLVNILLVIIIWVNGISGPTDETPAHLRPTFELEIDQSDYENYNQPEETPPFFQITETPR